MKLLKLDQCSKASYVYYCDAFKEAHEIPFSSNLMNLDYNTWIIESKKLEDRAQLPSGYVPSHTFFLVDDSERLLGNVSIRTELNDYLSNYGGNIGYVVSPEERGRKYGKKILGLALEESKKLGLREVLLTCDKSNIASSKTIKGNGGILDSEGMIDGVEIERYLIKL